MEPGAAEGAVGLPHRDIYSGMVAEELAKGGAFGREEGRYGFYFWSEADGFDHDVSESEDECARQQLKRWMLSGFVSERVCCRARVYDAPPMDGASSSYGKMGSDLLPTGGAASSGGLPKAAAENASQATAPELERSVVELLQGEPLAKLKADVGARRPRKSAAGEVIDAYAAACLGADWNTRAAYRQEGDLQHATIVAKGREQRAAAERCPSAAEQFRKQEERAVLVAGLMAFARQLGLVSGDYRREFAQSAAEALVASSGPARYGFVIRGDGAPKAYSNAYLPATWDRWRAAAASDLPAGSLSAIARIPSFENVPPRQRKEKANAYLLSLFNGAYFETLDILYALAS